jgi:hypothetical protein
MLYDFLRDERELQAFVDLVLPETTEDECFVLMLCVRRKYLSESEKEQLKLGEATALRREIIRERRQLQHAVQELCVRTGLYKDRNGLPIPAHAFAVYVTPNPRSYRKAAVQMIAEMAQGLAENRALRLDSMVKTQVHRAISRKLYLDLDIDPDGTDDWRTVAAQARAILGDTPTHTIQTRTGAHLLVQTKDMDKSVKRTFFQQLRELGKSMQGLLEIRSDAMVPVPGTVQGGAMPALLRLRE